MARPVSAATLQLDAEAARRAVQDHVATPLGIDLVAAAAGILRVAHANIVRGIRVVSVERGHDPRLCTLVPFGGAGPMHGSPVARELRIGRVAIPPAPGILCALGSCSRICATTWSRPTSSPTPRQRKRAPPRSLAALVDAADRLLEADRVPPDRRSVEVRVEAALCGAELRAADRLRSWRCRRLGRLADDFHAAHRARFGHAEPEAPIEIVGFGVTAIGKVDTPELPTLAAGGPALAGEARIGSRRVFFEGRDPGDAGDWAVAQVLARDKLLAGNGIAGPAVIEEISATTVLYPGDRAESACQRRAAGGVSA